MKKVKQYLRQNTGIIGIVVGAFLIYHFLFMPSHTKELRKENEALRSDNKKLDKKIDSSVAVFKIDSANQVQVQQLQDLLLSERAAMRDDIRNFTIRVVTSFQKEYEKNPTYSGLPLDSVWKLFKNRFDH